MKPLENEPALHCGFCQVVIPDHVPFFDVAISVCSSFDESSKLHVHESQGVWVACLSCARKRDWLGPDQRLNPEPWIRVAEYPLRNKS